MRFIEHGKVGCTASSGAGSLVGGGQGGGGLGQDR